MSYATNRLIDDLCACSTRRMELQWEKTHTKDEALKLLCDHYLKEIDAEHKSIQAKLQGLMAHGGRGYKQQSLDDLKAMYKIEDEAAKHTELKQKGKMLWGLCPFHKEKTPSFEIDPQKQLFHCFGCGKKGTIIDFFMALFDWDFKTACQNMRRKEIPHG